MEIYDYLKWRGDVPFEISSFNEVDSLVICMMSYTWFEKYIDFSKGYTIEELADIFFKNVSEKEMDENKSFTANTPNLLKGMASIERYKGSYAHDFVSIFDEKTTEQFFAFSLDLPDKTTFIVFRGTDDTLLGWKEDFCMSYTTTMAQREALKYLKNNIKGAKKYRVGGHSKGGNLAEYACVWLKEKQQSKIISIYSHDGPGNKSDFLPENYIEIYKRLENKILKFVPEFDIFGAIYNNKYEPIIIKSDGFAFFQHNGEKWLVDVDKFVRGEQSNDSIAIEKAFKEFLNSVSANDKRKFVDDLFDALDDAGLKNISDFTKGGLPVFFKTIKVFGDMNKESKEVGAKLIKVFAKHYKGMIANEAGELKDSLIKTVKAAEGSVAGRLSEINLLGRK